ncbi:LuxR C-terminal-related transcriptional regulator [Nocardia abscessus]|uniref:LuxR C-terminal-related transcriptional regulator n=1 Tax=Nocardia abscessus TaxID=120957 RepID=UPI002B4ABD3F|nr:LuxR C-terminal-related transcriptional regulator [Nocardia abscessus]
MDSASCPSKDETLRSLREVIAGPLVDIAARLSRSLAGRWPHQALVIFTRECSGRPRKVAGPAEIVDRIAIAELEAVKAAVALGESSAGEAVLAGARRWSWAVRDDSDTLLLLIPRRRGPLPYPAELAAVFALVATSIRQQVAQASPDYLAESRAASMARARAISELTAAHEAVLAGLLATLRAPGIDDRQARAAATSTASEALIALRSGEVSDRALSEEPPAAAFERLHREIEPLLRARAVTAEFQAPPADGRRLPGEVAHGARAITQSAVLVFIAQPGLDRLRIAWASDLERLVVDIRDTASGQLDTAAVSQGLDGRARTLRADLEVEVVPGWGSRVTARIPLDPPVAAAEQPELSLLNRRERDVLALVAAGMRNKAIAEDLGIAESTVKFHVAGLLKKLAVSSRGEAAVIGLRAGLAARFDSA